jgi:ferredoxin
MRRRLPGDQLYIDPEECIDCQACEPVCPWDAPLRDSDVPALFEDDIALNALVLNHKDQFVVPAHTDKPQPTPTRSPPTEPSGHDARHGIYGRCASDQWSDVGSGPAAGGTRRDRMSVPNAGARQRSERSERRGRIATFVATFIEGASCSHPSFGVRCLPAHNAERSAAAGDRHTSEVTLERRT